MEVGRRKRGGGGGEEKGEAENRLLEDGHKGH